MERAPLRPVPARPAGPVDPAAAIRELAAALPALDPLEARALALVALADRPRAEVAELLGVGDEELAGLLAAARKELRQTISPLPGSGWCERAEGLISERLDAAALPERDARRLDVHLRNCPRCVEHERRLVQATDALLASIAPSRGLPGPAPDAPLAPVPSLPPPALPQDAAPKGVRPGLQDAAPKAVGPGLAPPDGASPAAPSPAAPSPAAPSPAAPLSEEVAAAAEVLVTARTRRQIASALTWNAMIAIAVLLTMASIALVLAGILGAEI